MEERLTNWIYGIVGSSYVILVAVLLLFVAPAMNDKDTVPVFLESLFVLCVYSFSLWILHFAKSKNETTKLKLWSGSLTIHFGTMIYVLRVIENIEASLIIMIPEIVILILMVVGIFSIGRRLQTDNIN